MKYIAVNRRFPPQTDTGIVAVCGRQVEVGSLLPPPACTPTDTFRHPCTQTHTETSGARTRPASGLRRPGLGGRHINEE